MAETLGSLCDKLTVVKLKQWHTDDKDRLATLACQAEQLQDEINEFIDAAFQGRIPAEKLTFAANKVYKAQGNTVPGVSGSLGGVFAELAHINCELWHEQEKVYEFETVPVSDKDRVVKALAHLNLRRNLCIDAIDRKLHERVRERTIDGTSS